MKLHHGTGRVRLTGGYIGVLVRPDDPLVVMASRHNNALYAPEHRLVMAHHLGRSLRREEQVHHINGDRTDNRLGNLQLRQGAHGSGVVLACGDCGSNNLIPLRLKNVPRRQEAKAA